MQPNAVNELRYKPVILFLSLLITFSAGFWIIGRNLSPNWSSLLMMWSPGLAAIGAGIILRRGFRDYGLRLGKPKYLVAAWALPIGYSAIVYGMAWISGLESVPSPVFLKRASFTLHLTHAGGAEIVLRSFLYISTMGLLNIGAFGEELGWRGYLFPELHRLMNFRRAALGCGVIWAVWHWPMVIWGHYNGGTPVLFGLACLTVMAVSSGVCSAWFRLRSGSIWPCFVMHSAHNAIIQMFFDRISVDHGYGKYFTGEFGAGMALVAAAIAIWILLREEPVNPCGDPEPWYTRPQPCFSAPADRARVTGVRTAPGGLH